MWCHPYCVYDYPSSISVLKPVKTANSSTVYVITPFLSKTSHVMCKPSQVAYVCHHISYTWHYIHTLWQHPLLFMTPHALYSLHHTHYIWHLIYSVWCHIHSVCYITEWLYMWHQTLYVMPYKWICHKHRLFDVTDRVIVWCNTRSECDIIQSRWDIIYKACDLMNIVHVMS